MKRCASPLLENFSGFIRKCIFSVLSVGPIPNHIAFIMDGNRRYSKKCNWEVGAGHEAGFSTLMSMLKYCYELDVKYLTVYAFSIDNFKRKPDEVQCLMDLILEKIEGLLKEESILNQYNIRVYFIGNLKLLSEPVRAAAEKVMKASAHNTKYVLLICMAYTSCDEIVHAVQMSCEDKIDEILALNMREEVQPLNACGSFNGMMGIEKSEMLQRKSPSIKLVDVERHMYMAVAPDPDILIRSSGENRLSNFLTWQSSNCPLYSPASLWPEIGLWHLVWAVLNFQRSHSYFERKKKHS